MKNLYIALILMLPLSISSFGHNDFNNQNPKVGDVLVITKNKGETYKYIDLPRLNTIVKRGGIASYKSVYGLKVSVVEVVENKYGKIVVKLERVDGKKFFNQQKHITASYEKAISSGELKINS